MMNLIRANRIIGMFIQLLILILFALLSNITSSNVEMNLKRYEDDFDIFENRKDDFELCFSRKYNDDIKPKFNHKFKLNPNFDNSKKGELALINNKANDIHEEEILDKYFSSDLSLILLNHNDTDKVGFEFWNFFKIKSIKSIDEITNYGVFKEYKDYLEFKILYDKMMNNLNVREINDLYILPSNNSTTIADELSSIIKEISGSKIYTLNEKIEYDKFMADFKQFQVFRKYKEYKKYREFLEFVEYKNKYNSTSNTSLTIIEQNDNSKNNNTRTDNLADNVRNTSSTFIQFSDNIEYNIPKLFFNLIINFLLTNLIDFLERLKENDDKSQFILILIVVILLIIYLFKRIYLLIVKLVANIIHLIRFRIDFDIINNCNDQNHVFKEEKDYCNSLVAKFDKSQIYNTMTNEISVFNSSKSLNQTSDVDINNIKSKRINFNRCFDYNGLKIYLKENQILSNILQSNAIYKLVNMLLPSKEINLIIGQHSNIENFLFSIIKNYDLIPVKFKNSIKEILNEIGVIIVENKGKNCIINSENKLCIASSDEEEIEIKEIKNLNSEQEKNIHKEKLDIIKEDTMNSNKDNEYNELINDKVEDLKLFNNMSNTGVVSSNLSNNNRINNSSTADATESNNHIKSFTSANRCKKIETFKVKEENYKKKINEHESITDINNNNYPSSLENIREILEEEKIFRFDSLEEIGKGGFGLVLKGKHKIDQMFYAIKVIKLNFPQTKILTDLSVVKEVNTAKVVENKNVVRYITCWFQSNINGLKERINKKNIKEQENFTVGGLVTNTEGGSNFCSQIDLSRDINNKDSQLKSRKNKKSSVSKTVSPFNYNTNTSFKDIVKIIEENEKHDSESSFDVSFAKLESFKDKNEKNENNKDGHWNNVIIEENEHSYYSESVKSNDCCDDNVKCEIDNNANEDLRKKSSINYEFSKKILNFWDGDDDSEYAEKIDNIESFKNSNNIVTNEEESNDNIGHKSKYFTSKRRSTFDSNNKDFSQNRNDEKDEKRYINSNDSILSKRSKINNYLNNNNKSSVTPSNSRKINKHSSNSQIKKEYKLEEGVKDRKYTMDLQNTESKLELLNPKPCKKIPKTELFFFIQMELCNGLSLDKYLSNKVNTGAGISRKTIFSFLTQLLNGLKIIHSRKIIHRDIK